MIRREATTRQAMMTAAARAGQQHAEPPGPGWPTVLLRVAGAGLLIAAGAIHLDLYLTGYRTIPVIGWLFLLQVIAAFGLALAVLATGGRPGVASRLAAAGRASRWRPSAATCCRSGPGCSGSTRSAPPQAWPPA